MDLNLKIVLLSITFLVLSAMFVSGLMSPSYSAVETESFTVLNSSMASTNQPDPEKRVISAPLSSEKDNTQTPVVMTTVVSSEVKSFVPEFDEKWCQEHYPDMSQKKIALNCEDIVIKDKDGRTITDYQTLSLQLAPMNNEVMTERAQRFEDAYVDVKGVGPLKINSIRFTYEATASLGR
jgi:hypothetical protein